MDNFLNLFDNAIPSINMQYCILCLIPMKKNLSDILKYKAFSLGKSLQTKHGSNIEIVYDECGNGDGHINTFEQRKTHNGKLRQILIEKYLKPRHTHVLWIDADIFYDPETIIEKLLHLTGDGIGAPAIYLENYGERWYDIKGFIEEGIEAGLYPPFFKQSGSILELDSVGAFYMISADILRTNVRYDDPTPFTEHWPICQKAISMGKKVRCDLRLRVIHADLQNYGEKHH
jgi:hypothetical protein